MSETNVTETTTETPAATEATPVKKAVAKPKAKAPTTKPAVKANIAAAKKAIAKAKPAAKKDRPDRSMADVPAATRRKELVKLLKKSNATDSGTAKPISVLAAKLGYGTYDVYCLAYPKYPLAKAGLVETCRTEENPRELSVYLTKKGQKVDVANDPLFQ